eukprot:917027-Alexandrium_andersonii.AAC.1
MHAHNAKSTSPWTSLRSLACVRRSTSTSETRAAMAGHCSWTWLISTYTVATGSSRRWAAQTQRS